jgi:ribonucleoside-diphosphate reductase alpha chain
MARKYRNIGIGVMGLADCLVMLGLKYGSEQACIVVHDIMDIMFRAAVFASVNLAVEKGSFPGYSEKVWDSEIIKSHFSDEEISQFKKTNKLRNCSLLSIAPTGSN